MARLAASTRMFRFGPKFVTVPERFGRRVGSFRSDRLRGRNPVNTSAWSRRVPMLAPIRSTSEGRRRQVCVMSWLLTGLAVLVLAAALVLLALNVGQMDPVRIGVDAILAVAVGLYAGTSRLITAR